MIFHRSGNEENSVMLSNAGERLSSGARPTLGAQFFAQNGHAHCMNFADVRRVPCNDLFGDSRNVGEATAQIRAGCSDHNLSQRMAYGG